MHQNWMVFDAVAGTIDVGWMVPKSSVRGPVWKKHRLRDRTTADTASEPVPA
jgi:hypothetical protein